MFSSSREVHVAAVQSIHKHCSDLAFALKSSNCVSFGYDSKEVLNSATCTFPIGDGSTRNISTGPTKFLGHTVSYNLRATAKASCKRFVPSFLEKLVKLDLSPIRGEYKLWILRTFLMPAFHFVLAVDGIP